jgi:hypothetical protein
VGYQPGGLYNTVFPWSDDEHDETRRTAVLHACQDICDHPDDMPLSVQRALADTPFFEYTVELPTAEMAITYVPFPKDSGGDGTVVFVVAADLRSGRVFRA